MVKKIVVIAFFISFLCVLYAFWSILTPHRIVTIYPPSESGYGVRTILDIGNGITRYETDNGVVCYVTTSGLIFRSISCFEESRFSEN